MSLILHVRNFGKIKSADIDLGNYTLFVGDNNSGKSYIMQLIYMLPDIIDILPDAKIEYTLEYHQIKVTQKMIDQIVFEWNRNLEDEKDDIGRRIFRNTVPCEKLYVSVDTENLDDLKFISNPNVEYESLELSIYKNSNLLMSYEYKEPNEIPLLLAKLLSDYFFQTYFSELYLPSARTGLLLLYRNFFAESTDMVFSKKKRELGLTQPVYEFLRELQTYMYGGLSESYELVIEFMNEHLLDGKLSVGFNNQIFYTAKNSVTTPLYMSSAMINELTPIWMALTGSEYYAKIFIDEVETSLHPKKQMEMARLLNRINNHATNLIISTHSDTMAAAINLLYIVSKKKQAGHDVSDILGKLGYEEDDLLQGELKVYQFKNQGNHSIVEEIPYFYGTGFDFEQFDLALEGLLKNANIIVGGES